MNAAACPAENELVQFARGLLSQTQVTSVSSHLDSCESCRLAVAYAANDEGPVQPVAAGTRVGRYVIEALLGAGAMGSVFSAIDAVLHRRVALKLLHEGRDVARLEREAQSMARLNHPHVTTVFEFGTWEGGRYIAMELVDGLTLDAWLPGQGLGVRRAMLLDAGRGLHAAHLGGVVHRDFKPRNLLVGRDGRIRVTDFGLSRVAPGVSVSGSGSMLATQAGMVIGTPAYMSPEQLEGAVADERSDQFAFATVWVETFTGARPFGGSSHRELREAMNHPPRIGREVPRHERAALQRALSVNASARFSSVDALLAALARRPKSKWPWVALAVGLLLVIGSFAAWRLRPRPEIPEVLVKVTLKVGETKPMPQGCVERLAVANPAVAELKTHPGGFSIIGLGEGTTTLVVWPCDGERVDYAVRVVDPSAEPVPPPLP